MKDEMVVKLERRKVADMNERDWLSIHNVADEIFHSDCWKNCNSYCCKTNHVAQDFSLMKCGSAGMVFPQKEYEFLEKMGVLQDGFASSARKWEFVIDIERNLKVKFVTSHCDLGGICTLPKWRPLICKFYPLYPVISPKTMEVESYTIGSMLDQYWEKLGIEHPCWLLNTHGDAIDTKLRKSIPGVMAHPYLIFYFGAANIFVNHIVHQTFYAEVNKNIDDPRKFFKDWEVLYLTGKLQDLPALKLELVKLHDEIEEKFGSFSL